MSRPPLALTFTWPGSNGSIILWDSAMRRIQWSLFIDMTLPVGRSAPQALYGALRRTEKRRRGRCAATAAYVFWMTMFGNLIDLFRACIDSFAAALRAISRYACAIFESGSAATVG